jgi:hypothetical protein
MTLSIAVIFLDDRNHHNHHNVEILMTYNLPQIFIVLLEIIITIIITLLFCFAFNRKVNGFQVFNVCINIDYKVI